jgi:ADP-ribose pyrophosphatase YjhB (NUDIX family)
VVTSDAAGQPRHEEHAVSNDTLETSPGWLTEDTLESIRGQVPMVYVEAVPVRLDHLGRIEKVGLLLRAQPDGAISRAVVSGRVQYKESLRDALWRHCSKDLGPEADPQLPAGVAPFTVAEYFPDPDRSDFHDPRQHAVALGYVVPVLGECAPAQDALDLAWLSPAEATSPSIAAEMSSGHGRLVRRALAFCGQLP